MTFAGPPGPNRPAGTSAPPAPMIRSINSPASHDNASVTQPSKNPNANPAAPSTTVDAAPAIQSNGFNENANTAVHPAMNDTIAVADDTTTIAMMTFPKLSFMSAACDP